VAADNVRSRTWLSRLLSACSERLVLSQLLRASTPQSVLRRRVPVQRPLILCAASAARLSNRDLAADLDNLITRQVEIIRHVGGVALHECEHLLLPAR
jgi:hypothetical protein